MALGTSGAQADISRPSETAQTACDDCVRVCVCVGGRVRGGYTVIVYVSVLVYVGNRVQDSRFKSEAALDVFTSTHTCISTHLEHANRDEDQEARQLSAEPHDEVGGAREEQGA